MNELIPIKDRNNSLATAPDAEIIGWYVSNMPPNTIRAYKNAVDKIDTWFGSQVS